MPAPSALVAVLREWLQKAENDLVTAAHTLKLGKDCPTDTVCFHAQQSHRTRVVNFFPGNSASVVFHFQNDSPRPRVQIHPLIMTQYALRLTLSGGRSPRVPRIEVCTDAGYALAHR